MRSRSALIAAAAGLLASPTLAHAGTIQGTPIVLEHEPAGVVARGVTDGHGQVTFENLKAGRYASEIMWDMCTTRRATVDIQSFQSGESGSVDLVSAHKWFNLAALKGSDEAKSWRASIAREMNTGQIAEAQRLAREWLTVFR